MSDIHERLTEALNGPFTLAFSLDISNSHKFIIFSDHHKGAGDGADEFRKCEGAYDAALQHYRSRAFTLILLGDVEELWEQGFKPVERRYRSILQLEGSFGPGRYYRVWGNHDDAWMSDKAVMKHLGPYKPPGSVVEGIRIEIENAGQRLGRVFMVHGHQGDFGAEKIRSLSRFVLKPYRLLQRLFGIGKTTPAKDVCLRGDHDREMYEWAAGHERRILIAGHTHRPVWSSRTHLQKLEAELQPLEAQPQTPERDRQIEAKKQVIETRRTKVGDCNDVPMPKPCYFNTGCCKFDDGDITGIELEDGVLRLIKWSSAGLGEVSTRTVLEEAGVEGILSKL